MHIVRQHHLSSLSSRLPARLPFAGALIFSLLTSLAQASDWTYTVRPGDNLWNLTERYLAGIRYWRPLERLNRISDPLRIPPGTQLRIPVAWLRPVAAQARVVALQGEVEKERAGSTEPLSTGHLLAEGDRVLTAANSNVTLAFADNTRVLVLPESDVKLVTLRRFDNTEMVDTHLKLLRGRMENLVRPAAGAASRFEIDTPAAVTSVRGTGFRVGAEPTVTQTEVLEGKVAVSNTLGKQIVSAGFGLSTMANAAPEAPTPLLPPPDPGTQPSVLERVPVTFQVSPLAGAMAYRLQIAADPNFSALSFDGRDTGPLLHGPDLPDGEYSARVRGVDARNLEGHNTDFRFVLNARPEPPFLSQPAPQAAVIDARPDFAWAHREGLDGYHFQLGSSPDFAQPLLDLPLVSGPRLKVEQDLVPGTYYWRVAAIDPQEGQGPFSDAQGFRRPPPGPALEAPMLEDARLTLRWRSGLPGQSFHFQLATDAEFANVLHEETTDESQVILDRPAGGRYFLHARTIDVDGYEGPYGTAQTIEVPKNRGPWWLLLLPALLGLPL